MNTRILTATLALAVIGMAAPRTASAGGEIQAYERPYTGYNSYASYQQANYPPPMPANYARPAGMYYGGSGYCSPCASMPYGYSAGRPGFLGGNDILTAGLLGVGLGYLIFH